MRTRWTVLAILLGCGVGCAGMRANPEMVMPVLSGCCCTYGECRESRTQQDCASQGECNGWTYDWHPETCTAADKAVWVGASNGG